jgi:hypothetical protein
LLLGAFCSLQRLCLLNIAYVAFTAQSTGKFANWRVLSHQLNWLRSICKSTLMRFREIKRLQFTNSCSLFQKSAKPSSHQSPARNNSVIKQKVRLGCLGIITLHGGKKLEVFFSYMTQPFDHLTWQLSGLFISLIVLLQYCKYVMHMKCTLSIHITLEEMKIKRIVFKNRTINDFNNVPTLYELQYVLFIYCRYGYI